MPLSVLRPIKFMPMLCMGLCLALSVTSNAFAGQCHKAGQWLIPSSKQFVSTAELSQTMNDQQIVLLGEQHDIAEHHRWQLQTLSALFARHQDMALGFEMFPRRVQPALDKWVAGELNELEFLKQSDWSKVWGYDAKLYMPLFHFARINKIPMLALNIDRSVVRTASKKGIAQMSEEERQGVSLPAPASADYLELLANTFGGHGHSETTIEETLKDERFLHFVDAQQLWDRAMAERLADAVKSSRGKSSSPTLLVGIMGTGHIVERFGIPHQLADLGISKTTVLLPSDDSIPCTDITARTADAIFGISGYKEPEPKARPLLGVHLLSEKGAIKIAQIVEKSVAEQSGLKQGDAFISLAGKMVASVDDVVNTVQAMLAGTWLPIVIERDGKSLELVAKFPVEERNKTH